MTIPFIAAHTSNYTVRGSRTIDRIVMHYTAGDGDTAQNNGKYFQGANRKASAHYFVDENTVVQSVKEGDIAWHAGNWDMNQRSIGVEMCSKKDAGGKYYIPEATMQRAAELVWELKAKYGIPTSGVIRHYDVTGKNCPFPMVEDENLWKRFLAMTEGVEDDRTAVQRKAGLSDATMDYLAAYKWGEDLFKKLAKAMK